MNCPNCGQENGAGAKFCSECGTKLRAVCPQCGAEPPPGAKFCPDCGAALDAPPPAAAVPPNLEAHFHAFQQSLPQSFRDQLLTQEGENRLVTVLFADMSRSVETTRDLHPEDAAALVNRLLRAMVDVLIGYEGRIDGFHGDGALAVFGSPRAHEDDPERAIRAAMGIREEARKLGLEVTAGINTGEVYVGEIGSERHREVTVMGPVVNLAARLQAQAEPGQILVGEATYRLTRRAFTFTPLSLTVKGLPQPVPAYTVEQALPRPEKARGIEGLKAELIGRDEELTKLKDALAELLQGHGQIVTLIGEAGVGKSRLVAEMKPVFGVRYSVFGSRPAPEHRIPNTEHRFVWLEGRCLELGMTASYWLFIDLFRDLFAWLPEEDDRARGERLVAALRELEAQGHLTGERVEEIGPLLGHMLSLRFGTDWDQRLQFAGPEQIRHQTFLAVRDFLVALARRQPLLLVLEDLHWADSLSLDLISLLMEALTLAPILLLCVYRPEPEHRCARLGGIAAQKCAGRHTEILLRELTPGQSRRLVEALLSIEELPARVRELILEKARGNPFFVEEVVRSLIATGAVYREGETWRARPEIETMAVPESIQSVILTRVDRLEREAKQVLESAAVIGRLFRRRLLAQMTRKEAALDRALAELEDQALIYQERAVPEEEFSFQHVLTQETVYGSILRRRRAAFHLQVAEAMEALYAESLEEQYEQLAYHYERSGADEKAVEYLLKAGEKARWAYLNEEAIGYFQRALARLEETGLGEARKEWRFAAIRGLGQVYFEGTHHVAEAEEYLREAIVLGREIGLAPLELARLYYRLGHWLFFRGRYDEMLRVGEEGLSLLGTNAHSAEAALMNVTIGCAHSCFGPRHRKKWREFHLRNAEFIQNLPYSSEEMRGPYTELADVYYFHERNFEEALSWLHALEVRAQEHHDLRALAAVQQLAASFHESQGDLSAVIAHLQEALEINVKTGDAKHQSWYWGQLGQTFLNLGNLQEAEEHLHRALEMGELAPKSVIANCYRASGTISRCLGSGDRARVAVLRSIQLFDEIGWHVSEADAMGCLGHMHLALGERQQALQQFQAAMARVGRLFPAALSGLESAYEDPQAFRDFCRRFQAEHPSTDDARYARWVQWYLEPTEPFALAEHRIDERFVDPPSPAWTWQDPFSDCSYTLRNGLQIQAANGRDLWWLNHSAPRLLRSASSDFAIQTICVPATPEKPAIGGLLLWKDERNYLRLDRGIWGPGEISFHGCIDGQDLHFGRGRLPAERILLRLERLGTRVNALCSADGERWFTAGQVEFPIEDPVEVGLHAIGMIDRTIYPGAYPEGTAIRFERFDLWGGTPEPRKQGDDPC
jgi:class 3 adenylate cyclase/tetratricopeptide (TPR) repeat protein